MAVLHDAIESVPMPLPRPQPLRDNDIETPVGYLVTGKAEDALCARIPAADDAVLVRRDDRVGARRKHSFGNESGKIHDASNPRRLECEGPAAKMPQRACIVQATLKRP